MPEITYELTQPMEYSHGGETYSGKLLQLRAPGSKHRKECLQLKQLFMRALKDQREISGTMSEAQVAEAQARVTEADSIDGTDVMRMIAMSSVSLGEVVELTRGLLVVGGHCTVDGTEPLTGTLADRLTIDDLEGVVGAYLAGFILRSVLRSLSET